MHRFQEKGPTVQSTEHTAKSKSAATPNAGFFAMLRASLVGKGAGRPVRVFGGRRFFPGVLVLLTAIGALAAVASLAFASSPPVIDTQPDEEEVFATRVHLTVDVSEAAEAAWRAEYITVQKLKEAEEKHETASWTVASSGTASNSSSTLFLGSDIPGETGVNHSDSDSDLPHLEPSTTYDARFHIENPAKETAERTFTFTTIAITKPEIAHRFNGQDGTTFTFEDVGPTSALAKAQIESNGAETKFAFEYAPAEPGGQAPAEESSAWVPFGPAATGTVTVAEDFAVVEAKVTTLTPETRYYARVRATNKDGAVAQRDTAEGDGSLTTPTARPVVSVPDVRNVTGAAAHLETSVLPHGLETEWRFEYAESEAGPWKDVAGAEGTVSQAQAEALPEGTGAQVEGSLSGLNPSTVYYVRLFAKSAAGEGHNTFEEPISTDRKSVV